MAIESDHLLYSFIHFDSFSRWAAISFADDDSLIIFFLPEEGKPLGLAQTLGGQAWVHHLVLRSLGSLQVSR